MPLPAPKLLLDLTPLSTPGGARGIGRYIRELAMGLSELGDSELHGIELVGITALNFKGDYCVVHDLGEFLTTHSPELLKTSDYYSWAYRQRLAFWLAARRIGAKAVHFCDPHATPRFMSLSGAKRIVTCHDLVPTRFPDHYLGARDGGATLGRLIERQRYRSADLVIAVSDATKHDVCTLLDVPDERVVRVYNGVNIEQWAREPSMNSDAVLERLGLLGRTYALYVGGADWRKNVEGMMAALAQARQRGLALELVWAGHLEAGPRANVERHAASAGVSEFVHYIGYVSDEELSVLYRRSLAHLFVSRLEGFGLTVVEAMACGCPVVTTNAGSLSEVAGDAALMVDPEDPQAIALALMKLGEHSELRRELVLRGRARAQRFSRGELARATAAVYRKQLLPS
ncbi:MAG TPA: glycosyltransferase family 1 protein [Polyangiaceae bacterium]